MDEKRRRRWFRFGLRTLLLVMVPLCAALAWTAHSLVWIKQRHNAMLAAADRGPHIARVHYLEKPQPMKLRPYIPTRAPGCLWVFGEEGISELRWDHKAPGAPRLEDVRRLFPEAKIVPVEYAFAF